MRLVLFLLAFGSLTFGLFGSFLYLMTMVDPGLLEIQKKAAAMMEALERDRNIRVEENTLLPPEDYLDASSWVENKSARVFG